VVIGVRLAGTIESDRRIAFQAMLGRIERGMLAGEDQARLEAPRSEGVRDRCKLDGFGPGADDQPDMCRTQPSP